MAAADFSDAERPSIVQCPLISHHAARIVCIFMAGATVTPPAPAASPFFLPPLFVPTGHLDNSPAFQRRGACARPPVPPGRLTARRMALRLPFFMRTIRSSLRDLERLMIPGVETPGYCHPSLCDCRRSPRRSARCLFLHRRAAGTPKTARF